LARANIFLVNLATLLRNHCETGATDPRTLAWLLRWPDPPRPIANETSGVRLQIVSAFLSGWTARRAAGPGLVAGLAAFILWPAFVSFPQTLLFPFVIALSLTSFCGLSILVLTAVDFRNNRRGRQMRRIRAFDLVFGLILAVPSAFELAALLR